MSVCRALWSVAALVAFAACGGPGSVTSADIESAAARWSANAPETYFWSVEGTADGVPVLYEVVIARGVALPLDPGTGDDPRELYDRMLAAIEDGEDVRAAFDDQGYPVEVEIGDVLDVSTRDLRTVEPPRGCSDAEPGSPTDLSAEPAEWPLFATYARWTDAGDCPVRIDVITETAGPDHCDWGDVTFLTLGDPIGSSTIGPDGTVTAANRYVWDPEGDLARSDSISVDVLPAAVEDTGYRRGDAALWADPSDPSSVYVVDGTSADRYVLDPDNRLVCA